MAVDPWWSPVCGPNHVLGIGGATQTLAQLTVRRPARRMLDLGTGCGIQAFLAAEHSDQVAGVDLNPRAINLSNFNAQLNNLTAKVRFLEGSLFEPVAGEAFDL